MTPDGLAGSLGCEGCPGEGGCSRPGDEGGVLCRVFRDYAALLEELGLSDSAQIPSLGADLLASSKTAAEYAKGLSITAAGFLSFASGQLRFIRALENAGADLELFVPECGEAVYTVWTSSRTLPPGWRAARPLLCLGGGDLCLDTWPGLSSGPRRKALDLPATFPVGPVLRSAATRGPCLSFGELYQYGVPFIPGHAGLCHRTLEGALRAVDLALEGWPPARQQTSAGPSSPS